MPVRRSYSLVTQQPLGKAQFGGQRFGEMEVQILKPMVRLIPARDANRKIDVEGRNST